MRYRVLLLAEAANPEWVSVPLVGWSLAAALRSVADVHIATQVRNKAAFERAGLVEGRDFTAIDTEALMRPLWKIACAIRGGEGKGWTTLSAIGSLSYPFYEWKVWRLFGARIKAGEFDIVHRITPLTPTAPSLLAARCAGAGVPFVLGPLNGGLPWPKAFWRERHREKEWLSYVRGLYRMTPGVRRTWRKAAAVIAGSRHTAAEIPPHCRHKLFYIPENGINLELFKDTGRPDRYDRLDLCFIGRLVPYKGPDIAIEAARPLLETGAASLTIVGDGPMAEELRALVARLGLGSRITFTGWVEHARIAEIARENAVFLFPSVREFGGGAVLEAMAAGLVPIIADYGGPGEIVADGTGFKLGIGSREALVEGARTVLSEIASGKHDLSAMARRGRERVETLYTWKKKAEQIIKIYQSVTSDAADDPSFGFFDGSDTPIVA